MHGKEKRILLHNIPRLTRGNVEYEEIDFHRTKRRRSIKVYIMYLFTVGLIFILCGAILLSCFFDGTFADLYERIESDISLNNSIQANGIIDLIEGILIPTDTSSGNINDKNEIVETDSDKKIDAETLYDFDYSKVPSGEIPILPMDLSMTSYGSTYIHNSTGLIPDTEALLSANLVYGNNDITVDSTSPAVLIVHTHGTEAYSKDGAISYTEGGGEVARSSNTDENVVAVGRALNKALRKRGILSVHCEIMHDETGYRDAYSKAEETIKTYLERFPTIRLVIDLHRDSIVKSSGELVRPVTLLDENKAAQIMCVVGSNYGGEDNDRWESNLALALQFSKYLNDKYENLCRPVYLKASTYNQEIAQHSLLLEIGSSGNSLEEAFAVCNAVSESIYVILFKK